MKSDLVLGVRQKQICKVSYWTVGLLGTFEDQRCFYAMSHLVGL